MRKATIRKVGQVLSDPVLRRWLIGRVLRRISSEPAFDAHRPPYLDEVLPLKLESPASGLPSLAVDAPRSEICLTLPGETVKLQPGDENTLFERAFPDPETLLALHRFAWLTTSNDDPDSAWVKAIWSAWRTTFATPDDGWAWHPYTAAERAINILEFSGRYGLPGESKDTLEVLAMDGPAIATRLEYFGDHHTSNHLANNGRGLFTLGLTLGLPDCADLGGLILVKESKRIFAGSGILREGSSHYHALLAHNYAAAWKLAKLHNRPETSVLEGVVERAFSVLRYLILPGGLPLIGDISPDCPPSVLLGKIEDRVNAAAPCDPSELVRDGWLRFDDMHWSGLWHAAPEGWSQMPGHGHQDCGSFELHFDGEPVFVDPGRGQYGDSGEALRYLSVNAHNGLCVDGADPFPPNKPYYNDAFRQKISGPRPQLRKTEDGVILAHHGFGRLPGVGAHKRVWYFSGKQMILNDSVEGQRSHTVTQTLITPLAAQKMGDGIILQGKATRYHLSWQAPDVTAVIRPITRWRAYGQGEPANAITLTRHGAFPLTGQINLQAD